MDFTKIFLNFADKRPEFKEAINFIKQNSKGKVWIIGGYVCRGIIQELYDIPAENCDLDFVVEEEKSIDLPVNWKIKINNYGNPKLIGPNYEIDYIPIKTIHSINRRGLSPTIDNFFSGTPLNIQSIAFDVDSMKVIGTVGMKSIENKNIAVNNLEQAKYNAKLKNKTVNELIANVAKMFNFGSTLMSTCHVDVAG